MKLTQRAIYFFACVYVLAGNPVLKLDIANEINFWGFIDSSEFSFSRNFGLKHKPPQNNYAFLEFICSSDCWYCPETGFQTPMKLTPCELSVRLSLGYSRQPVAKLNLFAEIASPVNYI